MNKAMITKAEFERRDNVRAARLKELKAMSHDALAELALMEEREAGGFFWNLIEWCSVCGCLITESNFNKNQFIIGSMTTKCRDCDK